MTPSTLAKGLIARLGIKPTPIALTYEVTWRCNLACAYCDRHTPMPNEMSPAQALTALGEFHALGMRQTFLDGGDPLTLKHIAQVVDFLTDRAVTVAMNTNGILVPKKMEIVRKLSLVKISLDGPRANHDAMRGAGSFDKALAGATAARDAGITVEFTCTVGRHNASTIEATIDLAAELHIPVVFQPALNSLFLDTKRDGSSWQLEASAVRQAFDRIERIKRHRGAVGNGWSSLRHFRTFPEPTTPPCAAGWVSAAMDPEGVVFPCGQVNRRDRANNVVRLGVRTAFANLSRTGCSQCWCARLVEGNYAWGMRVDRMLPPVYRAAGHPETTQCP